MTRFGYLSTRGCPGHFEPGEGFGSPFANTGLASTGSIADRALRDEPEELAGLGGVGPAAPHLHGAFEGKLTRAHSGRAGSLGHEQADQVLGQQPYPQFLLDHRWRHAAQHLHPQGGFDVADVEFIMPAARVERSEFTLGHRAGILHRGHEHLAALICASRTRISSGKARYCSRLSHGA
jgi:hypothetical protein